MKIVLISTLGHNPGDEFIRLGLEHVLRQIFPNASMRPIHKQDPRSLFSGFTLRDEQPHRLLGPLLYRFYAATRGRGEENYLDSADLIVFAGSPFIWRSGASLLPSKCSNAEWIGATWKRLFHQLKHKPVFNLAAGTSAFNSSEFEAILLDREVVSFLSRALNRAEITTSRDEKTREILSKLGFETQLIPCSSLLAAKGARVEPQAPEYVVINLMPAAAPSGRGHRGDPLKWLNIITAVVADIEKRHPVMFVSHFQDEDETAARLFPGRPRFYSKDPLELLKIYSRAIYGICNRVHSGAAVATFSRPVIAVGGDYRNNLIKQFGMPAFDHRELDIPTLMSVVSDVETNYEQYVNTLRDRMDYTEKQYLRAIKNTFTGAAS